MVVESFWQRPMAWWTYDAVMAFLDERLQEGEHLEYKQPTYNENNLKWEVRAELLETFVAWANTNTGLMIIGVKDDKSGRPGGVVGINHRDPERTLRDHIASKIEPYLRLEMRVPSIPDTDSDDSLKLALVRVRLGPTPPYLLRGRGVYVRVGGDD